MARSVDLISNAQLLHNLRLRGGSDAELALGREKMDAAFALVGNFIGRSLLDRKDLRQTTLQTLDSNYPYYGGGFGFGYFPVYGRWGFPTLHERRAYELYRESIDSFNKGEMRFFAPDFKELESMVEQHDGTSWAAVSVNYFYDTESREVEITPASGEWEFDRTRITLNLGIQAADMDPFWLAQAVLVAKDLLDGEWNEMREKAMQDSLYKWRWRYA